MSSVHVAAFSIVCVTVLGACKGSPEASASAPAGSTAATAAAPAQAVDPNARKVEITAGDKGFSPSSIPAKKGESLTLRFTRTTQSECLKAVEFPELKIKRDLPVNQPVEIPVRAEKSGEIKFQCWMAMEFGKIVVE